MWEQHRGKNDSFQSLCEDPSAPGAGADVGGVDRFPEKEGTQDCSF